MRKKTISVRRTLFGCVALVPILAGSPVDAASILFNDGGIHTLADAQYANDFVYARNVGCGDAEEATEPCASPGAATTLELSTSGEVRALGVLDTSSVSIAGGYVEGDLTSLDDSTVAISSGRVDGYLRVNGRSVVTISGGTLAGWILAADQPSIALVGGSVQGSVIFDDLTSVAISGGSLETSLAVHDASAVTISGGTLAVPGGGDFWVGPTGSATIAFAGSDFAVNGTPVGYGPIAQTGGTLTGILESGDPLEVKFSHASSAYGGRIVLTPTPQPPPPIADILLNDGSAYEVADWVDSRSTLFVRNVGCGRPLDPGEDCVFPGAPTSLNLPLGGAVGSLDVRDSSSIVIESGIVGTDVVAHGTSSVLLDSGLVSGQLETQDQATLDMIDGTVVGSLEAHDESDVTVEGGSLDDDVRLAGAASMTITGGRMQHRLEASDSASIDLSGGTVAILILDDRSALSMSGGLIDNVFGSDDFASAEISGGRTFAGSRARARGASAVTITGGDLSGEWFAYGTATIGIVGGGFAVDGTPVGDGPLPVGTGNLTGTLDSGDPIDIDFTQGTATVTGRMVLSSTLQSPPPVEDILLNDGSKSAIDDWTTSRTTLFVRNVGCGTSESPSGDCPTPGAGSELQVSTGGAAGSLEVYDSSLLVLSGGVVGSDLRAHDSARIVLSDGTVSSDIFELRDDSSAAVSGGTVTSQMEAFDQSSVTVSGGQIGYLRGYGSCVISVSGGESGGMEIYDDCVATVSGGLLWDEGVYTSDRSTATVSGGEIAGLYAVESSSITVIGSDFALAGTPVDPGPLTATAGSLTGRLQSGDDLDCPIFRADTATITLVPEPVAALLQVAVLLALVALVRRDRVSLRAS